MAKLPRTHWTANQGPAANARRELPPLVSAYFAAIREMVSKTVSPAKMHGLRLATKRLRYTLELFRACYGPGLETRLAELRQVQQLLGDVADSTAARELLAKTASSRVRRFLENRESEKAEQFRKFWSGVFDAPGREQWWTRYLSRNTL